MITIPARRAARAARQLLARRMQDTRDGGFILLESIIAITIVTIVMSAVGAEFVTSVATTSQQRTQQGAVQIADSTVDQIRALHASDLVTGRDSAGVLNQFAGAPAAVRPWLAGMDKAIDTKAAAGSGATAAVPTIATVQKPGSVSYTVNEYLGWCSIAVSASTDCVASSTLSNPTAVAYLRAVVAITWQGSRCGSSACTYVTSTLLSAAGDPTFRINSAPYSAPVAVALGPQINAIGDTVSLQLRVQTGTGVPQFTWAVSSGSLPGGLALSPTGLISGTVGGTAGNYSATIQVTDAFLRTDIETVTWTVEPALVLTNPGPQATTTVQTVKLTLAASGGDGAPYTYADAGGTLPPGLTISAGGVITGKPTTAGNYAVKIIVSDKSGTRSTTGTFTWTVTSPPLAASNPGPQQSTLSTAITALQLSASGGTGNYVWSDASPRTLPAGLSMTSAGKITGTPTATGTSTVVLTVNDGKTTKSVSFTWVVTAKPTIASPGNQVTSVGAAINLQLTTSCPDGPCTYAFGGTPPSGLAISSSGLITGTVGTTVKTFAGITVTVTDASGATATSASFSWTVNRAPTISSPGDQTTQRRGSVNLSLSGLASGGTGSYVYSASGLPSWLSLNPSTGKITGTAPSTNSTTTNITVSITDASGVTATSAPFAWNVTNLANSFGDITSSDNSYVNIDLDGYTTGGSAPYTYTASGLPSWLTLTSSTGTLRGWSPNLRNSSTSTSGITITVTDSKGAVITTDPFTWYVTDMSWSLPSTLQTSRYTSMNGYSAASYVSGGGYGKTYSASNLPTGLSMNSAGTVYGSTNTRGTWITIISVTDNVGATVSTTVVWTVS